MGLFDAVIEAESKKQVVGCSLFFLCDFLGEPLHLWEGDGDLVRDSITWQGLGPNINPTDGSSPLISIDGIEQSLNGQATNLTILMSGIDNRVVNAASADVAAGKVEGRDFKIWMGWFRRDVPVQRLEPLGSLIPLGKWTFQKPTFICDGPTTRQIEIEAETLWVQRSRGAYGLWTDRDQQRRFPGDRGLDFVPTLVNKSITWPEF